MLEKKKMRVRVVLKAGPKGKWGNAQIRCSKFKVTSY
jgi:hypothetical protein